MFGYGLEPGLSAVTFTGVMNPDVELDAIALRLLINALKEDSSLGLVTGRVIYSGINAEPISCQNSLPLKLEKGEAENELFRGVQSISY